MTTQAKTTTRQPALQAADVLERYRSVRSTTERLCVPLTTEDHVVQSMRDVSPPKWHLAHSTWFFETLVLKAADSGYRPVHPQYANLFNSYYNSLGKLWERGQRGILSRPTVKEAMTYRQAVDEAMTRLLSGRAEGDYLLLERTVLGLHHEQQHQELLLTDIKHILSCNPLQPAYAPRHLEDTAPPPAMAFIEFGEGLYEFGHDGTGFAYDNEHPRHRHFLESFEIGNRLVINGEFLEFIRSGGYQQSTLWLSDGWDIIQNEGWSAPLYWIERDGTWYEFTLHGLSPLDPYAPVCHVSFFEADAYARWTGARLPSEFEWELAARDLPIQGNFVESGAYHPTDCPTQADTTKLSQCFGDVWEWTSSPYAPYPRYQPPAGPLGEYNAKFMCNQMVLRGGSCASPQSHLRATYRNFFPPAARWQFMGIRLARDV